MSKPAKKTKSVSSTASHDYSGLVSGVSELLEAARRASVRTVNAYMTATYWEVGRRIVEFEQGGEKRAGYGEELLERLADDLSSQFGRGFSRPNLQRFRQFYLAQPVENICSTLSSKLIGEKRATPSLESREPQIAQTLSAKSAKEIRPTVSGISTSLFALTDLARAFPLPWSHYVLLNTSPRCRMKKSSPPNWKRRENNWRPENERKPQAPAGRPCPVNRHPRNARKRLAHEMPIPRQGTNAVFDGFPLAQTRSP
jgi:hypothetical protein